MELIVICLVLSVIINIILSYKSNHKEIYKPFVIGQLVYVEPLEMEGILLSIYEEDTNDDGMVESKCDVSIKYIDTSNNVSYRVDTYRIDEIQHPIINVEK